MGFLVIRSAAGYNWLSWGTTSRSNRARLSSSYAGCYDVTPDYNPGGKGGTYNDAGVFNDISVWYMGTREAVFDDTSRPPVRAAFNLLIFSS